MRASLSWNHYTEEDPMVALLRGVNKDKFVDLHTHTIFSDGQADPRTLIREAWKSGIWILAITDHNNVDSIEIILSEAKRIKKENGDIIIVIPGVELSTVWEKERIHILGLFINPDNVSLKESINIIEEGHWERVRIQIKRLKTQNLRITEEVVRQIAGHRVPNWKIMAQALVQSGDTKTVEDARKKYLLPGRVAHVTYSESGWKKLHAVNGVRAICNAAGVPVLAHAQDLRDRLGKNKFNSLILTLKEQGLIGVDTSRRGFHKELQQHTINFLQKNELILVPGSDHHGIRFIKRLSYSNDIQRLVRQRLTDLLAARPKIKELPIKNMEVPVEKDISPIYVFDFPFGRQKLLRQEGIDRIDELTTILHTEGIDKRSTCGSIYPQHLWAWLGNYVVTSIQDQRLYEKCIHLARRLGTPTALREFLSSRLRRVEFLSSQSKKVILKPEHRKFIQKALFLYVPIAYRFSFDSMGSELRNSCFCCLYPRLSLLLNKQFTHLVNHALQTNWDDILNLVKTLQTKVKKRIQDKKWGQVEVQARLKNLYSSYAKILRVWEKGESPKNLHGDLVFSFLGKFRHNLYNELRGVNKELRPISREEFGSVCEDFIGLRVIVKSKFENIDDVYEAIYNEVIKDLLEEVVHISPKSKRLHHRRFLILGWISDGKTKLPIEVQIKTETDYFLGRAYYWYSKGFHIRGDLYPVSKEAINKKRELISICRSEIELIQLIFDELFSV